MINYWAVAHRLLGQEDPHFAGPFATEALAREGKDHLAEAHQHLEGGLDWAFYVVRRPPNWRPQG